MFHDSIKQNVGNSLIIFKNRYMKFNILFIDNFLILLKFDYINSLTRDGFPHPQFWIPRWSVFNSARFFKAPATGLCKRVKPLPNDAVKEKNNMKEIYNI